jgi:streptomycin 6-kinase
VDHTSPVAEATRSRLVARFGAAVGPWWARLPGMVDDLAARWDLVVGEPVGRGNTSLVLRCRRGDGRRAILKLTPDPRLCGAEALVLGAWQSSGRVPLLWGCDAALGALLLEAIPDETPLAQRPGGVALGDVAELIGALHRTGVPAVGDGVVSLADRVQFVFAHWIERHGRDPAVASLVPGRRLERGRELARRLAAGGGGARPAARGPASGQCAPRGRAARPGRHRPAAVRRRPGLRCGRLGLLGSGAP